MKSRLPRLLLTLFSVGALQAAGAQTPPAAPAPATASITVNAAKSDGPVNPYVFGQAVEAADSAGIFFAKNTTHLDTLRTGSGLWNPEKRVPVAGVLELSRQLRMGMMRYPGGSLANNFDWRKAVGPLEQRGEWKFGVDEFIEWCRQCGVEPMFTLSDYALPAEQMPENNAQLLEYLNAPATKDRPWALKRKEWGHAEPYGVKWFELGNESNNGNSTVVPHRQYTSEQYAEYALATMKAMRAIDPTIKLGLVMGAGVPPANEWNTTVPRLVGPSADFAVIHSYVPHMGASMPIEMEGQLMQAYMAEGDQYEYLLQSYHKVIREACGRDLPLAITEYNVGFESGKPKPYRFSYGAGLECADLMRVFLKPENGVAAATYWQYLNGFWGMLRSDTSKAEGGTITEKPAFPLYRLWGMHFGTGLVHVEVDGPKASFAGVSNALPAQGDAFHEATLLGTVKLRHLVPPANPGCQAAWQPDGSFAADFKGFSGNAYPELGDVDLPVGTEVADSDYSLSFEARYLPSGDPGAEVLPLGFQLGDSRGWNASGSVMQVKALVQPQWKTFTSGLLNTLADAPGVRLIGVFESRGHTVSGRLEMRNLQVQAFTKMTFPAYSLLTSSASLSADGKTLYLIVFNKSDAQDIAGTIQVAGFDAASAKYWEVNGPGLGAIEGVGETVAGKDVPVADGRAQHLFPAHSMTALELRLRGTL